jgi:hypothetical protein
MAEGTVLLLGEVTTCIVFLFFAGGAGLLFWLFCGCLVPSFLLFAGLMVCHQPAGVMFFSCFFLSLSFVYIL